MKIKTSVFVSSSINYKQCPKDGKPELALIGRSNVGKSSLINMLLGCKHLAKVSSTPGKTRLINHFLVNDTWHLVDLPGYGWASVGKLQKQHWEKMVRNYLLHREHLSCVLVLVDARLKPQKLDLAFINWLGAQKIPFSIFLTKADKEAKHQVQSNLAALQHALGEFWEELPLIMVTSAKDGTGRAALLKYIQNITRTRKNSA